MLGKRFPTLSLDRSTKIQPNHSNHSMCIYTYTYAYIHTYAYIYAPQHALAYTWVFGWTCLTFTCFWNLAVFNHVKVACHAHWNHAYIQWSFDGSELVIKGNLTYFWLQPTNNHDDSLKVYQTTIILSSTHWRWLDAWCQMFYKSQSHLDHCCTQICHIVCKSTLYSSRRYYIYIPYMVGRWHLETTITWLAGFERCFESLQYVIQNSPKLWFDSWHETKTQRDD